MCLPKYLAHLQVAEEVRRELAQQLGSGAPDAALHDAEAAEEVAGEAAEHTHACGALPQAVKDLDRALGDASPTKIAAVGDDLPQVGVTCSSVLGMRLSNAVLSTRPFTLLV